MGQKVWPTSFRVGITENWRARWFAHKAEFGSLLVEDHKIRRHIKRKPALHGAGISVIEIEREREAVTVIIRTARPGLVIGRQGKQAEELKKELEKLTGRSVNLNIVEIKVPELEAQFVAELVAEQLLRRGAFRRLLKNSIKTTMMKGAEGIKIAVSGRLAGAEMARSVFMSEGQIPLHTLQADVSYGMAEAHTTMGSIGVKVWIYRGLYTDRKEASYGSHAKKG